PSYSVAWSPDGKALISGGARAIRVWNPDTGDLIHTLERHNENVIRLSFSADGRLLASKSGDGITMLWRCDTWEWLATLDQRSNGERPSGPAFHPTKPNVLATLGDEHKLVHIWELDVEALLAARDATPASEESTAPAAYCAAKVVLL